MCTRLVLSIGICLLGGTFAAGQSAQSSRPSQENLPSADVKPKPTAKKVWTNEDLTDLPANSEVSVSTPRVRSKPKATSKQASQAAVTQSGLQRHYSDRINRLKEQIAKIDPQIAALQAAIDGKQVDEPRKYGWQRPVSYPDELARLQAQRSDLLDQISAVEDEARHNGVPANALP